MNIVLHRLFPAVAYLPSRNAAIGIGGLAILVSALAIAAATAVTGAAPAQLSRVSSVTAQLPAEPGAAGIPVAAVAAGTPVAAVAAGTPVASVAAGTPVAAVAAAPVPFEKALVPDIQLQPNYYYCGPAATRIAITADGHAAPSMDDLAWMLGTTTSGTESAFDTTRVLNSVLGATIYQTREIPGEAATAVEINLLKADVVNAISNARAVVANIAGYTTDLNGGWHSYGGHYLTVVGYGQGGATVKIVDPANTQGDGTYWMSTYNLANWIGTHGYSA